MVHLNKIYTKGGDKGQTSLGTGERIAKTDARILAMGDVDEANAIIGMACLYVDGAEKELLQAIQNTLFDVGADLACPDDGKDRLRLNADNTLWLEGKIDLFNERLQPLTSFVLPGGSTASAHLHHARTVVRRAERAVLSLHQQNPINPHVITYLNRLSDLMFVLARVMNDDGNTDVLWQPNRIKA